MINDESSYPFLRRGLFGLGPPGLVVCVPGRFPPGEPDLFHGEFCI